MLKLQALLSSSVLLSVNALKEEEIQEICSSLDCRNATKEAVCGLRGEDKGYNLKEFGSECDLLKFGCNVTKIERYGLISYNFCEHVFHRTNTHNFTNNADDLTNQADSDDDELYHDVASICDQYACTINNDTTEICAIRKEGNAFRIKLFKNKCELSKHNCKHQGKFIETFDLDCRDLHEKYTNDVLEAEKAEEFFETIGANDFGKKINKLVIVRGLPLINNGDINSTIESFFDATHSGQLHLKQLPASELSRRMMHNTHPKHSMIFEPVIPYAEPDKRFDDYEHLPLLHTCFHKCPESCPDIYSPVCGKPGRKAKEPTLLFKNHCFMDIAQCKMYRENKSITSRSSTYQGLSFMFCLGPQTFTMFRVLPIVKTLQRMGRLKQRGSFYYRIRNYRTANNNYLREPNLMG